MLSQKGETGGYYAECLHQNNCNRPLNLRAVGKNSLSESGREGSCFVTSLVVTLVGTNLLCNVHYCPASFQTVNAPAPQPRWDIFQDISLDMSASRVNALFDGQQSGLVASRPLRMAVFFFNCPEVRDNQRSSCCARLEKIIAPILDGGMNLRPTCPLPSTTLIWSFQTAGGETLFLFYYNVTKSTCYKCLQGSGIIFFFKAQCHKRLNLFQRVHFRR